MTIDRLVNELVALRAAHGGDVEVIIFQYDGGLDAMCDVKPVLSEEYQCIELETTYSDSGIRR